MFGIVFGQIFSLMGFTPVSRVSPLPSSAESAVFPGAMLGGFLIGLAESFCDRLPPGGSTLREPLRLRAPHHHDPHPTERTARIARDPEGVSTMGDGHRRDWRAGRGTSASGRPRPAAGRRRRVGRTGRGAPRETGGRRRCDPARVGSRSAGRPAGDPARAVRHLPVLHERGQPLPLRTVHAHLRAAGARTQRRRRVRRSTRPRLRRVLRLRRVPLRDHGLGAFRPPLAGGDRDPDRDGVDGAARPAPRPRRRAVCSATTSRS